MNGFAEGVVGCEKAPGALPSSHRRINPALGEKRRANFFYSGKSAQRMKEQDLWLRPNFIFSCPLVARERCDRNASALFAEPFGF